MRNIVTGPNGQKRIKNDAIKIGEKCTVTIGNHKLNAVKVKVDRERRVVWGLKALYELYFTHTGEYYGYLEYFGEPFIKSPWAVFSDFLDSIEGGSDSPAANNVFIKRIN